MSIDGDFFFSSVRLVLMVIFFLFAVDGSVTRLNGDAPTAVHCPRKFTARGALALIISFQSREVGEVSLDGGSRNRGEQGREHNHCGVFSLPRRLPDWQRSTLRARNSSKRGMTGPPLSMLQHPQRSLKESVFAATIQNACRTFGTQSARRLFRASASDEGWMIQLEQTR